MASSSNDWSDLLDDEPDNVVPLTKKNPAPPADPKDPRVTAYIQAAILNECGALAGMGKDSGRNHQLNIAALKLGTLPIDRDIVRDSLIDACNTNGLLQEDGHKACDDTINSGFAKADREGPRDIPTDQADITELTPEQARRKRKKEPEPNYGRSLRRIVAADINIETPEWAWHYNGKGRIQKGTLSIFAGRPGAGKSSAARWMAAKATKGDLYGCWDRQPLNVAYIAAEEPWEYVVAPGLVAAGADMNRILTYDALDAEGKRTRLLSNTDEHLLTQQFIEDGVSIVIVDPLMSTISSAADVHRNNEVRDYIEPWARIAHRIGGFVLGIAHLRKNTSGDAVSLITGSSAFGEVARSVFAFVKDPDTDDSERVMSQAKNSTGHEDLALTYRIDPVPVKASDGTVAEVGRFVITGDSDVTAEEVLANAGGGEIGEGAECRKWLRDYLEQEGRAQAKDVVKLARESGGWGDRMVYRQAKKIKLKVEASGSFPRTTWWSL
jgi:hypothetical protein